MPIKAVPVILIVLLVACCCLIVLLCGAALVLYRIPDVLPPRTITSPVPTFVPWTEIPSTNTPLTGVPPTLEATATPAEIVSTETLETLKGTVVPVSDLRDLACRLEGICNVPETMAPPAGPLAVGTQQDFWVIDSVTNKFSKVKAVLRYITPHSYFWVEEGLRYDNQGMKTLMETFENEIYPTDRQYFGSEWSPGVDGDVHIYILYTRAGGGGAAGFYVSLDEYLPQVHEYSNAHEIFYVDGGYSLNDEFVYSVLAHEFQHMIHWYQDRNEEGWLNEGFSDLADYLNGYVNSGWDTYFAMEPDLQLNYWPPQTDPDFGTHYGASYLFTMYFLDRFGNEVTQALVHHPENGLEGVDATLAEQNVTDPLTGRVITADDFFIDWVVTNYLLDPTVSDGRYYYRNYPAAPRASETETVYDCPQEKTARQVHQYGTDYILITCPGAYTLHFEGYYIARVVPADPHSGSYAFWSNKGDVSNMTLTREFDFTDASGPLTFTYWTWYDLEKDFDYTYLEASTDGLVWTIILTPSGTGEDPSGNSYGWGYNGESAGWIQETVDLSRFAGQKVYLRFEYVTDAMVNGNGFFLDDVSIPETGYWTDFESDDGGWEGAGFVRIQNVLPQTFRLALILKYGDHTEVQMVPLSINRTADIPLTIGQDGLDEVVLVVGGTTRFTLEKATYQFEIR